MMLKNRRGYARDRRAGASLRPDVVVGSSVGAR